MQQFSKFLGDNWQSLLSIIISVIVFIIALIKKKPKAYDFMDYAASVVASYLEEAILKAESMSDEMTGKEKLTFATNYLTSKVLKYCHLDDDQYAKCVSYFERKIEECLSTPRKKII